MHRTFALPFSRSSPFNINDEELQIPVPFAVVRVHPTPIQHEEKEIKDSLQWVFDPLPTDLASNVVKEKVKWLQ